MKGGKNMKLIKINPSQATAYTSIKTSMSNNTEISVCNALDACGCTGNGNC